MGYQLKPWFQHTCKGCILLGNNWNQGKKYDLYYCNITPMLDVLVWRDSNELLAEECMIVNHALHSKIPEQPEPWYNALLLAQKRGFIDHPQLNEEVSYDS